MSCCDNTVKSYLTQNRYDASCCVGVSAEVHTTTYWRPGATVLEGPIETACCIQKKNKSKINITRCDVRDVSTNGRLEHVNNFFKYYNTTDVSRRSSSRIYKLKKNNERCFNKSNFWGKNGVNNKYPNKGHVVCKGKNKCRYTFFS